MNIKGVVIVNIYVKEDSPGKHCVRLPSKMIFLKMIVKFISFGCLVLLFCFVCVFTAERGRAITFLIRK